MGTPPSVPPLPLTPPRVPPLPLTPNGNPAQRQASAKISFDGSSQGRNRISKGSGISGTPRSESDWSRQSSGLGESLNSGTSCTSKSSRGLLQSYRHQLYGQPVPTPPLRQPSVSPSNGFADISTGQTMRICFFPTQSDPVLTRGTKALSFAFLVGATVCTYFALQANNRSDDAGASVVLFSAVALVLVLISLWFFLRIRTPTSLIVGQVNGAWCFILQRVALAPVVKPLRELEAFIETFGFFSQVGPGFVGKQFGHSTSSKGAVNLFFCNPQTKQATTLCCSLEDPLAFFLCLRDLTTETSHHLGDTTTDYVFQWDLESNQQSSARGTAPGTGRDVELAVSPRQFA